MELRLLYENNNGGKKIFQHIKEDLGDCDFERILLNGNEYMNIRLGQETKGIVRFVNTPRAIRNSLDNDVLCPILAMNGIACGHQIDESLLRTYEVVFWGFTCLSVKVWGGTRSQENAKHMKESENPRMVDTARRALYLSGLDLGKVIVAYTARRRYKVLGIDPSPEMREKDIEALVKRMLEFTKLDERIIQSDVKMGADPEFMMLNSKNGRIVSASDHFPREGTIGCDNIRIPNRSQRPIAEIRPRPDASPFVLTANIKQALNLANQMAPYRNVRWVAGSQPGGGFSIGGHIHFSNTKLNASLLRALDNFVALPIFLIENPVTAARRRKKYGQLGDHRVKDYGGFEYRTPGSWLVSQNITLAILCLAKLVVSRYPWLPYNYLNTVEAHEAFYQGDQEYFLPIFNRLWSHLQDLDMFKDYSEQLQVLFDMVKNRTCWNEKTDFRKAWMISGGARQLTKASRESSSRAGRTDTSQSGTRSETGRSERRLSSPSNQSSSNSNHNPSTRSAIVSTRRNGQRAREPRSPGPPASRPSSTDGGRVIEAHQVRRSYHVT
ncbi:MAG TPA: hypothetical protein VN426_15820 [Syntrophomonadaceae bacterium]|nr:hypothetical protein [Syntrophomonadaceae bacterium]